jgi:uridine phosphorylase
MPFAPSELILNPDGSVYHLHLWPEDLADTVVAVGDPDRVPKVSQYLDHIELRRQKREIVTHTGTLAGQRLTIISTGMGTDNVEIVLTELDALANIDLATREPRPQLRRLRIVRLGTSGSLQPDLPVGSLVASHTALGLDPLLDFYQYQPPLPSGERASWWPHLGEWVQQLLQLGYRPYPALASPELLARFATGFAEGHTLTCPGFYAPQGRLLRAPNRLPDLMDRLAAFRQGDFRFTNFEMETAAYYALGGLLGHQAVSLNAIVANRATQQFDPQPEKTVDMLIRWGLEALVG